MGRVIFISGTSAGLGKALAELLVKRGHQVFGSSRKGARGAPPGVTQLEMDVRSEPSVQAAVQRVLATAKRLDVLVNNAGVMQLGPVEEVSVEQMQAVFDTNFLGVLRLIQAAVPAMREQGGGRIVNVGSTAGLLSVPFAASYCATKFALEGLTQALRVELRSSKIDVCSVNPAFIPTEMEQREAPSVKRLAVYDADRERLRKQFYDGMRGGDPLDTVAAEIAGVIEAPITGRRNFVGSGARQVSEQLLPLPDATLEGVLFQYWGLIP
jgi:NAD(P)-dependent dehydrogenase (short-subunit alcohol dehydrogenase family)